jgi:hypothetical protein
MCRCITAIKSLTTSPYHMIYKHITYHYSLQKSLVFGKKFSRKSTNVVVFPFAFSHRSTAAVQTTLVTPVVI